MHNFQTTECTPAGTATAVLNGRQSREPALSPDHVTPEPKSEVSARPGEVSDPSAAYWPAMPEPLTDPELFELALTVFAGADPRQAHGYAKVNTLFLQDKADDLPFLGRGNLARLGRMALFRAFDAGELVFNDLVACICGRLSFPDLVTFATGAVQDVYPERIPGYIAVEALFTRDFDTRLADPTKAALIQVVATRAQTEERANATDIAQRLEQLWAEARDREAAVLQCNAAGEESSVPRGGVVKQLATACRKLSLAELTSLAIGVYSERNPQELPGYETIQPFCLEGEGRCRFRPDLRKPLIHWALRRTAAAEKDTLMEGLNDPYGSLKEVHHMKLVQALLPMPFAELLPFVIAVLQDTEVLEIPGYRQAEVLFAANNGHDLLEATRMCLPAILSQRATDEGLVDYHPFYLNKKLEWYQAHRQFVRQVVGEIMEEEAGQAAVTAPDLNGNGATSPNGLMDRRQRRALAKQQRKLERKQSKSARRTDEDEALDFNLLAEDFDDAATTAASRRRGKRKNSDDARLSWAGAQYSQKIIKCLQQIGAYSGHRPYVIFNDWIRLVEAALQALPAQVKALAQTGRLAEDTPETKALFDEVRQRYEISHYPEAFHRIWDSFCEATAILLDSAAGGLHGGEAAADWGPVGPDVIGFTYMIYANSDKSWNAQYFSPWSVSLLMAKMVILGSGERQVLDRLKTALTHPDNLWGQAVLLASMVMMAEKPVADDQEQTGEPSDGQEEAFLSPPDGKPGFRYFLDHIIPAALPYYDPIKVLDPCVGSAVMLLAVASQFPRWATHYNLVQFYGMDIDQTCVRMANINMRLYCLNSYGILMEEAGTYAIQALQLRQEAEKLASSLDRTRLEPKTGPATAGGYRQNGHGPTPSKTLPPEFTFESLFKRVVSSIPVPVESEPVAV